MCECDNSKNCNLATNLRTKYIYICTYRRSSQKDSCLLWFIFFFSQLIYLHTQFVAQRDNMTHPYSFLISFRLKFCMIESKTMTRKFLFWVVCNAYKTSDINIKFIFLTFIWHAEPVWSNIVTCNVRSN